MPSSPKIEPVRLARLAEIERVGPVLLHIAAAAEKVDGALEPWATLIPNLTPLSDVPFDVLNRHLKSLYDADWEDERGVIRFRKDLKLAELARAEVFHNARIFLNALLEEGGADATAAGYLTRAFVGRVIDRLRLTPGYLKTARTCRKVIEERAAGHCIGLRVAAAMCFWAARTSARKRLATWKEGHCSRDAVVSTVYRLHQDFFGDQ